MASLPKAEAAEHGQSVGSFVEGIVIRDPVVREWRGYVTISIESDPTTAIPIYRQGPFTERETRNGARVFVVCEVLVKFLDAPPAEIATTLRPTCLSMQVARIEPCRDQLTCVPPLIQRRPHTRKREQ